MVNKLSMVQGAINNPKLKGAVKNFGEKTAAKFDELDKNSKDPNINTITGKANTTANSLKVDKAISKLPDGSFAKVSNIINKGKEKIK